GGLVLGLIVVAVVVGGIAIAQFAGGMLAPCTVNCAPKIVTPLPEEASYRSSAFNFQVNYSSAWTVRDQDASSITLGTHVGSVQVVGARGATPSTRSAPRSAGPRLARGPGARRNPEARRRSPFPSTDAPSEL